MPIAGRDWKSGSIRTSRELRPLRLRGARTDSVMRRCGVCLRGIRRPQPARSPWMTTGSQQGDDAIRIRTRNCAPSQRSQTPLLHPGRSRLRLPDPEPPLRRVLRQGRPRPARRRRDRRLRARSLAARAGLPVRRRSSPACSQRRRSIRSWRWGRRCGRSTRARISELLRHDHPELRDNEKLRKRALVPMARRQAASADRGLRLHRFLFLEGARHQCRRHVPRQGQCACSRTGCTCRSAITAAPRPSWSAARQVRRPRGQLKPPTRGCAELRAVQAARFRTRDGRGGRPAVGDGRDADREAGGRDDLRLCDPERLERARHPAMGICAARAVPGQGVRAPRSARGS